MTYVGGGAKEQGCVFCNRLSASDDVASLILHRFASSFVIMNLFPYNTGHVLIVPNAHIATPEDADPAVLAELGAMVSPVLRALRRVLACHGFNVGFNVGSVAGAGIAEHLHEHVVPRWNGDANFMPILGATMVIPELIPVTYAKARAELTRELSAEPVQTVTTVVFDPSRRRVLVDASGNLPAATVTPDKPVWQSAVEAAAALGVRAMPAGWAGRNLSGAGGDIALSLLAIESSSAGETWREIEALAEPSAAIATSALAQLAPAIRFDPASGVHPG
jgi:ATP adenylyltransferase